MERLILIETSTALCSVALAENGEIVSYKESSAPKAHASLTAVFISDMLAERGLTPADCDAVCVSMGPGSYTGLRVGVSTAKGLCFGSGKPLLAVGTLDTLVAQADSELANSLQHLSPESSNITPESLNLSPDSTNVIPDLIRDLPISGFRHIIPMIDARRMEVYTAVFTPDGQQLTDTSPVIVDETSFSEYLEAGPVLFIGDGAGKCADILAHPNARFIQCSPKASAMLSPALKAFHSGRFEDVAYFEPFYLKEFVATVSKKKLF